ncbi:response regulator transcription factor [Pseudoalteromonas sp. JBTF-M23]|uniref:Response regulator transcription factor n=1 Tax=Pseudoalteromonas caenipelagi TaxID=2726988 RepID=A0A849VFN1_9GAMM|nr:response regulator transcription factor [Pseudoalteromonas caenipelagi]NOU50714.1 response regulator transcription factor [Pseudoalteromonas caenipelagi]
MNITEKKRILIADDHQIFRQGLRTLIEQSENFEVISDVADGEAAWSAIKKNTPDIAVLDITMPILSGFDVVTRIQKYKLSTKVIFLSMHNDIKIIDRGLSLGAFAYLRKDEAFDSLIKAMEMVLRGKSYLSAELETQLSEYQLSRVNFNLTKREQETLSFIAKGLTNKEIAEVMCLSVKTIDNHRTNLMGKLDVRNTAGLVRYALLETMDV